MLYRVKKVDVAVEAELPAISSLALLGEEEYGTHDK